MKKSILIILMLISQLYLFGQFVPRQGLSGGANVACFFKDGSTMWAGIQQNLYKTTDNGTTWTKVNVASDVSDIKCIAKAGNYLFVASGNGKIRVNKSSDGGNTWTGVQSGLPNAGGNGVYVPTQMAVIRDTLFMGTTTAGVWKTVDYGSNWVATQQSGGCVNAVFAKGDTLVIGGVSIGKPKWSANKGATMIDFASDLYKPLPTLFYNNCVAIEFRNGRLFFITSYAVPVIYTDDWGITLFTSTGITSPNAISVAGSKVYASSTDYSKFYVSSDNGSTFSEEKINGKSMGATAIYFDGSLVWMGTTTYSASSGTNYYGAFNSTVGTSNWQEKNNGLNFLNVTRLASSGNNAFAISAGKLYKTIDFGTSWNVANAAVYTNVSTDGATIYACKDTGLNKSTDGGSTWNAVTYFNGKVVTAFGADGQFMLAAISTSAGPELWMSSDGGTTWNNKTISSTSSWNYKIIVNFHKHNSNVWIAEMSSIYGGTGFTITTDGGATWTYKSPLNFGGYFASQGTRLLYQRDYEMYVSDNNGSTFRTFHTGMQAAPWPMCGGLFVENNTAYVYNTTNMGLYSLASTDTIWKFMGNKTNGMATYPKIPMISVSGKIFAAPQNASVWKLDSSASSGIENISSINKNEISLYPNPVNDEINISISKNNPSKISSIKIMDLTGKLVKEEISITNKIDISALTKGIYFLNILFDDQTLVAKKIIKL